MMGIPPADARELTWWEYQAVLTVWNDRHSTEDDEAPEAPSADYVARRMDRLAERGLARSIH